MKFKINKEAFDNLSPELQALYAASGDGYQLQVDGMPNHDDEIERLKAHTQKLIGENRKRDEAVAAAEAERLLLEAEKAKESGNLEALEKTFAEKLKAKEDEIAALLKERDNNAIETASQKLASEMAGTPQNQKILQRLLKDRLTVIDGEVVVLTPDGKPPASKFDSLTLDDLNKEFVASGDYDSLIVGTKSSGTGGTGTGGSVEKAPADYTEQERIELATNNLAEFNRIFNQG